MKSTNRDLELVRKTNRTLVSMAIRLCGPVSRVDLVRITGLSSTSIGRVVDELMAETEIIEVGQVSTPRGRPKSLLDINREAHSLAAIRMGPESIQTAISDYKCDILTRRSLPYSAGKTTVDEAVDSICKALTKSLQSSTLGIETLGGVGVAVAGLADPSQGVLYGLTNRHGWEGVEIARLLSERLSRPVLVDNDIRAVAFTSQFTNGANSSGSTLYVHICEGIGAAYIGRDKMVLRGGHDAAGLIGHTRVLPDGPRCGCGGSGCLEAIASDIAFIRRIRPDMPPHPADYGESDRVDLVNEGIRRAQNGDATASRALHAIAHYLGIGIGNAIMILDPDTVVLSGTMIDAGPTYTMDILRQHILQHIWPECQGVQIISRALGADTVLIGALGLVVYQPYLELQRENLSARSVAGFRALA